MPIVDDAPETYLYRFPIDLVWIQKETEASLNLKKYIFL